MKKTFYLFLAVALANGIFSSCSKTQSYAELVADEKEYINSWLSNDPYDVNFGHIINKDEEWVNDVRSYVLEDSIHPSKYIDLGQWYQITEGDFKRLYFRINSWGNDGLNELREKGIEPTDEQYKTAMRNKKKFYTGKNVLVRYDQQYIISEYDYDEGATNVSGDNGETIKYLICYSWNSSYYSNSYYGNYYGANANDECTSGGIAFPARFLWEGGNASIICPFSLVEATYSGYYYTFYYGDIEYTKPNFLFR